MALSEVDYPINQIIVGKRLRSLGDVSGLASSIAQLGLLNRIHVLPDGVLVAGLHRLEACKLLGWETIPVRIVEFDELDAELAEIDENLRRNDLTILQQAEHLARREEILAAQGLRAQSGFNGNRYTNGYDDTLGGITVIPPKTTADIAAEMGVSESTAQQRLQIARKLAPDVKEMIADTETADSTRQLLTLARMEPEKQREVAEAIVTGRAETVNQAVSQMEPLFMPHVSHNSGNNEWYTPAEYVEAARQVMGAIDLDPASSHAANKVVQAETIYTAEDDGLNHPWHGRMWLNPPYAKDLVNDFADKLAHHCQNGDVTEAIILVNNATETAWFSRLVEVANAIIFPQGRVRYWQPDGRTGEPLQGQAILYSGPKPMVFLDTFRAFGWGAIF